LIEKSHVKTGFLLTNTQGRSTRRWMETNLIKDETKHQSLLTIVFGWSSYSNSSLFLGHMICYFLVFWLTIQVKINVLWIWGGLALILYSIATRNPCPFSSKKWKYGFLSLFYSKLTKMVEIIKKSSQIGYLVKAGYYFIARL